MKKKYMYGGIGFLILGIIFSVFLVTVKGIENNVFVNANNKNDKIYLQENNIKMYKGEKNKIDILEEKGSYSYESSDKNIVEVTSAGEIYAKNCGTAEIFIKDSKGRKNTCYVMVLKSVDKIEIVDSKQVLTVGDSKKLTLNIEPKDIDSKLLTWNSSDKDIIDVDENGTITAKKSGKVIVSALAPNGKKDEIEVEVRNNTYEKKAIFFGDSITQGIKGTPRDYSWANYIGDNYDLKSSVNAGKSGWYISNWKNKSWIRTIIKQYKNKQFDYVILHGGINDIHSKVELGTFNKEDFSGNYNIKTVLGGLEKCIYTIKKQWPNAKIGFIVNYNTPLVYEELNNYYSKYYSAMKDVLNKWNIKYLDLFDGVTSNGTKYNELLKINTKEYIVDGLHLNGEGYKLISPYIYDWMNTL